MVLLAIFIACSTADRLPNGCPDPAGAEVCDGVDNDCDGTVDGPDAVDAAVFAEDRDGDGFGVASVAAPYCPGAEPDGWAPAVGDCDDDDGAVHPDAVEVCGNQQDDDCDGVAPACPITGTVAADAVLVGEGVFALAAADFDGDGHDDLAVGAYGGPAAVSVYRGGAGVASGAPVGVFAGSAEDGAGASLVRGDLDGDGLADLVVGAPEDATGGEGAGAVHVLRAPLSGGGTTTIHGAHAGAYFGFGIGYPGPRLAMGQIDGEGAGDLIAAAPYDADGAGAVYVFAPVPTGDTTIAAATAELVGGSGGDYFGWATACVDLDGDGRDDVLVGARGDDRAFADAGAVYVFGADGLAAGGPEAADARWTGPGALASAGYALAVGDADGDGRDDVFVSADTVGTGGWLVTDPGLASLADAATVVEGGPDARVAQGPEFGDFDGDGRADLALGTWGEAYGLIYGPVPAGTLALPAGADLHVDGTGGLLAVFGDLDGDGNQDLALATEVRGTDIAVLFGAGG